MSTTVGDELIEREAELSSLVDALAAARDGRGTLVLVEGPAGIGKTALLGAAHAAAGAMGMRRLSARATELERDHAFGVVRQLLEAPIHELDHDARTRLLSGATGHAAAALDLGESSPPSSGFAILNRLYWVLVDLAAERPLALFVDDAHWADEPSLRFLRFLTPRAVELRLAVVIATLDGEEGMQAALLDELRVDSVSSSVHPRPLSQLGVARLLREDLGTPPQAEFAAACRLVTAGNPFYLRELAADIRALGVQPGPGHADVVATLAPQAVAQAIRVRLARLTGGALQVARAVAVLAGAAPLRHVASLAQLGLDEAAAAADELARMTVFAALGEGLSFAHPIVRNSVYEDMGRRTRATLHARAARLLGDEDAAPERVACHLLLADPAGSQGAVDVLRDAARVALARGAPQIAARFLVRALDEPPPCGREDVLYELAVVEAQARSPLALEHLLAALGTSVDPRRRAQIALVLANELGLAGECERPVALLEAAIEPLDSADRQLALELEAMLAGVGRTCAATHTRTRARLARLESQVGGEGPGERLVLANLAFEAVIDGVSAERMRGLAERALGAGRLLEEVGPDAMAFYFAVNALCYADRYEEVEKHLQEALAVARRSGSLLGFALASTFRAMAGYRRGLLVEAEADGRAAIDAFADSDLALLTFAQATLADTLVERGELAAAESVLAAIPPVADAEGQQFLVWAVHARGRLRFVQGRPREALEEVQACGRTAQRWGLGSPSFLDWRTTAALIHLALDDRERARSLAREELALARSFGAPRALGIALRTNGLVEGGDEGRAQLQEAGKLLGACGAQLEYARALIAHGAALRRANRRVAARDPLRAGLDVASRCGATLLEQHARTELAATGARPRRALRSGVDALTPSELRVARMAAGGFSNRAIAQALFVTQKTVETHLGHVYAKLGLASRADLSRALGPGSSVPAAASS